MKRRKRKSDRLIETHSKVSYLPIAHRLDHAWARHLNGTRQIENIPLSELTPLDRNPRLHSKKQIRELASAMDTFSFTNPILVDAENHIIAGNGRFQAAQLRGMETVPCLRIENMTAAQ